MEYNGDKTQTRIQEQNVLNIVYGNYKDDSAGEFEIPMMLPTHIDDIENIPLQGFNYALKEKNPENIGVHFFLHDYQFERVWNYPDRYLPILDRFKFVLSPDFSPYSNMPRALKIYNVYRNRWCGRFWQDNGITVIPTVTWSDADSLQYCLDGIPKHSIIAISTMGEGRWAKWQSLRSNWDFVIDTLQPEQILLYGKDLSKELKGNIVHKRLISSKVAI